MSLVPEPQLLENDYCHFHLLLDYSLGHCPAAAGYNSLADLTHYHPDYWMGLNSPGLNPPGLNCRLHLRDAWIQKPRIVL